MATWDITIPAGSGVADAGSGNDPITPPSDFDGATIDAITIVGSPTITSDGATDDTIGVRWNINASGGADTHGGLGSDADSACFASLGDSASSDVIAVGSLPNPNTNLSTAAAIDWNNVAYSANYTSNMKKDDETCSWNAFTLRVLYTPSGTVNNVTRPDTSISSLVTDNNVELRQRFREALSVAAVTDASVELRLRDREALDTLATSDNMTHHRDIDRIYQDAIAAVDNMVALRESNRSIISVLDAVDSATQLRQRLRNAISNILVTDSSTPTYISGSGNITSRTLGDTIAVTDPATELRERVREAISLAAVTDTSLELRLRDRESLDNVEVQAFLGELRKHEIVVINNVVHLFDDVIATYVEYSPGAPAINERTRTSTLAVTDFAVVLRQRIRAVLSAVEATDSAVPLRERIRQSLDTIDVTDSSTVLRESLRDLLDTIAVTDADVELRKRYRALLDTIDVVDNLIAASTGVNTVTKTDTIDVTDTIIPLRLRDRLATDAAALVDALADNTRSSPRVIADVMDVVDNIIMLRDRFRVKQDLIILLDSFAKQVSGTEFVVLTDNINITDELVMLKSLRRDLADAIEVTDASVELRSRYRSLLDTIDVIDFQFSLHQRIRTLLSEAAVTDSATMLRERYRVLLDTIDVLDNLIATYTPAPVGGVTERTLTDSLAVTDFISTLRARVRLLQSVLSTTDTSLAQRDRSRLTSDTLESLIDGLQVSRARYQSDIDAITVGDASESIIERRRGLFDIVELTDQLLLLRHRYRETFDEADVVDSVIALYITEILNPVITAGIETLSVDIGIETLHINIDVEELDIDLGTKDEAGQIS